MFVEQLELEDFLNYIRTHESSKGYSWNHFDEKNIHNFSNNKNGVIAFAIEGIYYSFSDFDYCTNFTVKPYPGLHDKKWLNYMYGKFGTPYRVAFEAFRKKEKQNILDGISNRFDKDTYEYKNELN